MKTQIDFNGTKSSADTGAVKVVIIYENFAFATGVRGKNFARRLADSLGCSCDLSDATWRSDLFEREDVADAATLAAVDADYVIVSLLGEHVLPVAARNWIEAWLDDAGRRGAGLIVLADPNHSGCRVVEATRHYLHCACTARASHFSPMSRRRTSPAWLRTAAPGTRHLNLNYRSAGKCRHRP